MGLPVGMSIGQMPGSYGGVAQTHPGTTSQSTVNARAQTAFNVQPQVTVAYRTNKHFSDDILRKDFLFTFHPEVSLGTDRTGFMEGNFVDTGQKLKYQMDKKKRGYTPSGAWIMNVQQVNAELIEYQVGKVRDSEIANVLSKQFAISSASIADMAYKIQRNPMLVANLFRPLGVYHNRATHDATQKYAMIPNSNVSDIISVSKSNHCFMRDIWGIDLHPGDQLGFLYVVCRIPEYTRWSKSGFPDRINDPDFALAIKNGVDLGKQGWTLVESIPERQNVQIVPIVGHWDGAPDFLEPGADRTKPNTIKLTPQGQFYRDTQRYVFDQIYENELARNEGVPVIPPVYVPIGKVWAMPMHSPFNPNGKKNLVGPFAQDTNTPFFAISRDENKFHSIEVELSPFMKECDW